MRTAFSTLGCPEAGLDEVIRLAGEHGIDGLELRVHDGGIVNTAMSSAEVRQVQTSLARAELEALSLATYIKICAPEDSDVDTQLVRSIQLASDVGARTIRVFPGAGTEYAASNRPIDGLEELGAARLERAAERADEAGILLLLETHDSHPRGADIARILARLPDCAAAGAIWDVLHPWRFGEDPDETRLQLGTKLAYVQIKDATLDQETGEPILRRPGEGDIPLHRVLNLVDESRLLTPGRWVSLEWEKAWHPELPTLSEALSAFLSVVDETRAVAS